MGIEIRPVATRADRKRFVSLPRELYPPNSPWIRPLNSVVRDAIDTEKNPFYREGKGRAFLAFENGQAVGRILAHVSPRHQLLHNEKVGYFGLFECANRLELADKLFSAAS